MKSNFCYRFTILDSNNTREKKEDSQFLDAKERKEGRQEKLQVVLEENSRLKEVLFLLNILKLKL
jgi:hypothetical protein